MASVSLRRPPGSHQQSTAYWAPSGRAGSLPGGRSGAVPLPLASVSGWASAGMGRQSCSPSGPWHHAGVISSGDESTGNRSGSMGEPAGGIAT